MCVSPLTLLVKTGPYIQEGQEFFMINFLLLLVFNC